VESGFRLFHTCRLLPVNGAGWRPGVMLALAEAALSLFSLAVFCVVILSGALSACLCFTTLGSYVSVLVAFETLPYLAGAVESFGSLMGAIPAEDLCVDCAVRAWRSPKF